MKLFATPKSHFSRKVRLLLDHLGQNYELIDVGNVAEQSQSVFDDNPMMSVPVLEDGETWMIESDHIAQYLVGRYQPDDPFQVQTHDPAYLNARAIMNGIMAAEVKLILSARTGLDPTGHAFFDKARSTIVHSLAWLEARSQLFAREALSYADFHFISMWDHLKLYGLVPLTYPDLARIAATLSEQELIARSNPT